MIRTITI